MLVILFKITMPLPTVRERILLHLHGYAHLKNEKEVPFAISQQGIADRLGVNRAHVSKEIIRLKERSDDLIEEEIKHVKGIKRRRKVYFLTQSGQEKADIIYERTLDEIITFREDNYEKKLPIKDVIELLDIKDPLTYILKNIDEDGVLDQKGGQRSRNVFLGRSEELNTLKDLLDSVSGGSSQVAVIKGETGIGKTRLIMEFKPIAMERGFRFLSGACRTENADPYLPFKEAFVELVNLGVVEEEDLIKFLADEETTDADNKYSIESKRRSVFFDTVKTIQDISEIKPLVIFLDDIHWADKATLDLFRYISETLEDDKVLIIATYRPGEVTLDHPLTDTLSRLFRKEIYKEIALDPLDRDSTRGIIEHIVGFQTPGKLVNIIYEKTKGNPLFIIQLVKELIEEGKIGTEGEDMDISDIDISVPEVVSQIVYRKTSRLDDVSRRTLEFASVLGREFSYDTLEMVTGIEELKLLDSIDLLIDIGIISESDDKDSYCFSHELVREAAYNNLKSLKRKKLHRIVAESMEEHYTEIQDNLSDLANHFQKGDQFDKAFRYYLEAGQYAEKVFAHEDAIKLYEKGLEIIDNVEEGNEESLVLLERLGDSYRIFGKYGEGRKKYSNAMKIADLIYKDITPEGYGFRTRMCRKIAHSWLMQGDYHQTMEFVEKGFSYGDSNSDEWCILLNIKGWAHLKKGGYQLSEDIFDEELCCAKKFGSQREIARAHHNVGTVALQKGEFDKAIEHLEKAVNIFDEIEECLMLSKSYNNLGVLYLRKHNIDRALEYGKKSLKELEKVGDIQGIAMNLNNMGIIYTTIGDFDKALECHEKSMEIKKEIGDKQGMAESHTNLGLLSEKRGELDEAIGDYKKGLKLSRDIGDKRIIAELLNDMGWVLNLKGDMDRALEMLYESLKYQEDIRDIHGLAESHRNLGIVLYKMGKIDQSEAHLKESLKLAEEMNDTREIATLSRWLGDLMCHMGEYDSSLKYYEKGVELSKEIKEKKLEVECLCGIAETHLTKGDKIQALNHANRAMDVAKTIDDRVDRALVRRILGNIYHSKGELKKAQNMLWKSREELALTHEREELPKVYYDLARIMYDLKDKDNAERYLEKALKEFKNNGMELWIQKVSDLKRTRG